VRTAFPECEDLRYSVAHSGEIAGDLSGEHGAIGVSSIGGVVLNSVASVGMIHGFVGPSFTNSVNGRLQSYELPEVSLAALDRMRETFLSGFVRAAEALQTTSERHMIRFAMTTKS
jgi:hypothetical protein